MSGNVPGGAGSCPVRYAVVVDGGLAVDAATAPAADLLAPV